MWPAKSAQFYMSWIFLTQPQVFVWRESMRCLDSYYVSYLCFFQICFLLSVQWYTVLLVEGVLLEQGVGYYDLWFCDILILVEKNIIFILISNFRICFFSIYVCFLQWLSPTFTRNLDDIKFMSKNFSQVWNFKHYKNLFNLLLCKLYCEYVLTYKYLILYSIPWLLFFLWQLLDCIYLKLTIVI